VGQYRYASTSRIVDHVYLPVPVVLMFLQKITFETTNSRSVENLHLEMSFETSEISTN